jgi:hypothetical protein
MLKVFVVVILCPPLFTACSFFRKEATIITSHGTRFGENYYSARLVEKLKNVDATSIKDPSVLKVLKEALTEELIVEGALYSWARTNNVHFTDDQLVQHLRLQVGSDTTLKSEVEEAQPSMNLLRDTIYVQLIRGQLRASLEATVKPTDDQLKKHLEVIRQSLERPKIQMRQIIVAEEHEARTLLQSLREKKISFEDAAKKFSLLRSYKSDDDLPWIDPKDSSFLANFANASPGLQPKVYSTPAGYHLVHIVRVKKSANQSFAALRPQVETAYKQKAGEELYLQWLKDQVKTGAILIDQPRIMALTAEYRESF